jgi:hypothetical protein
MDDYRGQHQQAVFAAAEAIDNLRGSLAIAEEARTEVAGMVAMAVGDSQTDAAQSVRGVIDEAQTPLDEVRRLLAVASEELNRYAGGF